MISKLGKILVLVLLITSLSALIFRIQNPPKKVRGALIEPTPAASPIDEGQIPQGKFYAPILAYHHIAYRRPQNSYFVSPEIFDEQMKWLKDNNYQVISFDDFYQAASGRGKLPKKPIVLTFDDGNRDQYLNAFPVLKKYGFTATFFIISKSVGKGGITWDELRELQAAGNIIGSHTVNHDDLATLSPEQLNYELRESQNILEKNLDTKIKYLCYPGGSYDVDVIAAAKNAGYLAAVTTRHKVDQEIKNENSFYTLPRVHIDDEMPTFIDWVQGKNLF